MNCKGISLTISHSVRVVLGEGSLVRQFMTLSLAVGRHALRVVTGGRGCCIIVLFYYILTNVLEPGLPRWCSYGAQLLEFRLVRGQKFSNLVLERLYRICGWFLPKSEEANQKKKKEKKKEILV